MSVQIPIEILSNAKLSPEEFLIEISTHLYQIGKLSLRQAQKLAKLEEVDFQEELAKRDVFVIHDANNTQEKRQLSSDIELDTEVKSIPGMVKINEKEIDYKEILADEKLKKYFE